MKRIAVSAVLAVASLMITAPQVSANGPKPEDVVEFRQHVYGAIGWYFKPLGAMAKGYILYDPRLVATCSPTSSSTLKL